MNLVIVAVAAFVGGVLSAFLGFLDSKEKFDPRKFGKSIGVALLSGLAFAIGYSFSETIGARDIFVAILAGAGVDGITNRALGAARPGGET